MGVVSRRVAVALLLLGWAHVARAQTAEEVVDRCLTATGGREALGKLKSRSMIGTITLSTPAGDIAGSVEILNAAPNKSRSLIKADLSAFGAGQLVFDQRFDVPAAWPGGGANDRVSRLPGGRWDQAPVPTAGRVLGSELHDHHHQGGAQRANR